jgi:hypothetical protein
MRSAKRSHGRRAPDTTARPPDHMGLGCTRERWPSRLSYPSMMAPESHNKADTSDLVTTVLLLHCFDAEKCTVHFEPEGATHVLRRGDMFRLEAVLPAGQEIEVAYSPAAISVWAEQAWGTRAFNGAGRTTEALSVFANAGPAERRPSGFQSPRRSQTSRRSSYTVIGSPKRPRPWLRIVKPRLAAR